MDHEGFPYANTFHLKGMCIGVVHAVIFLFIYYSKFKKIKNVCPVNMKLNFILIFCIIF